MPSDAETLAELKVRVAELEDKSAGLWERRFLRLGALAAVAATFLSMATGVAQFYASSQDSHANAYAQFSANIRDLGKYDQQIMAILNSPASDAEKQTQLAASGVRPLRSAAMYGARQAFAEAAPSATATELALLAQDFAQEGDIAFGKTAMVMAVRRSVSFLHPEALRVQANLLMGSPDPADRQAAGPLLRQALDELGARTDPASRFNHAHILAQQVALDVTDADCGRASADAATLQTYLHDLPTGNAAAIQQELRAYLVTTQACHVPL